MQNSTSRPFGYSTYLRTFLRLAIILLPIVLIAWQWIFLPVRPDNLLMEVPKVTQINWLESRWAYFYLHLFTFVPVFALSFDRNVHYYTKWKALLPAILIVGAIFIFWDVFFTAKEVWGFNENYFSGFTLLQLPLEEWLFFITVPFACVFIYECLNFYIKKDLLARLEPAISIFLIITFLLIGFASWGHLYTSTTFLLTGFFVLYHLLFLKVEYRSRFYLAYTISLIPFLIVNGVLTGGYTQEPIVIYNPEEYFGIRITSVPIDDAVYGFLLLFGVVTLLEYFQGPSKKTIS